MITKFFYSFQIMLCNVSKYKTHYFYFGVNTSHSVMGIIIQARKLSVVWYFSPSFYPLYQMCHHHFPIIFWRAHCSLSCDRMHHLVPSSIFFFISCFFFSLSDIPCPFLPLSKSHFYGILFVPMYKYVTTLSYKYAHII